MQAYLTLSFLVTYCAALVVLASFAAFGAGIGELFWRFPFRRG